jgi:hypothetical protein
MRLETSLLRPDHGTSFQSVTLRVPDDALDPDEGAAPLGIDAWVAWHADLDADALIYVPTDAENLAWLRRWRGSRSKVLVPEPA